MHQGSLAVVFRWRVLIHGQPWAPSSHTCNFTLHAERTDDDAKRRHVHGLGIPNTMVEVERDGSKKMSPAPAGVHGRAWVTTRVSGAFGYEGGRETGEDGV